MQAAVAAASRQLAATSPALIESSGDLGEFETDGGCRIVEEGGGALNFGLWYDVGKTLRVCPF